jgi:hypothetical protein
MKLFKVELIGDYNLKMETEFYVVAFDPTSAYERVKEQLKNNGMISKRGLEMKTITLLAESGLNPDCGYSLLLDFKSLPELGR